MRKCNGAEGGEKKKSVPKSKCESLHNSKLDEALGIRKSWKCFQGAEENLAGIEFNGS